MLSERHAGFPVGIGIALRGNVFFRRHVIAATQIETHGGVRVESAVGVKAIVHHDFGLKLAAHFDECGSVPTAFSRGGALRVVPPEHVDFSVVRKQFPHLIFQIFLINGMIDFAPGNAVAPCDLTARVAQLRANRVIVIRVRPIDDGMIKTDAESACAKCVCKFPHDVAPEAIFRIVVGLCGIEERESVVMFCREHGVAATGFFREFCPFRGGVGARCEARERGVAVSFGIDFDVFLNPFAAGVFAVPFAGEPGIKSVVNEHSEFCIAPPTHARIAFRASFVYGRVVVVARDHGNARFFLRGNVFGKRRSRRGGKCEK